MGTELSARFYYQPGTTTPDELFCQLVDGLATWPHTDLDWFGFKVADEQLGNRVLNVTKTLSAAQVQATAHGFSAATLMLMVNMSFPCWWVENAEVKEGASAVQVWAFGDRYGGVDGADRPLEGHAKLNFGLVSPYLLQPGDTPRAQAANRYVEENLEQLTDLLFHLVTRMQPDSLKLYTTAGYFVPQDAHLVYYKDEIGVLDDLALIEQVWEQGLPGRAYPPLKAFTPDAPFEVTKYTSLMFHNWRSPADQRRLWHALAAALPQRPYVTPYTVRAVLDSGLFDTYTPPSGGFAVLTYPDYTSHFLDEFYLMILNSTGVAGVPRPPQETP
ncbi:MAG: hypothetical protein M3Z04_21435 [Chloroflexota bacterium]|nr:hypothetical protein [Chloroflexota bacterium]